MPWFVFKNTGQSSFIPQQFGLFNYDIIRFYAVGGGGNGATPNIGGNYGGGGGGGERRAEDLAIFNSSSAISVYVSPGGASNQDSVVTLPNSAELVRAVSGKNAGYDIGGEGGYGGTGSIESFTGGHGADADTTYGGGGGEAARDSDDGADGVADEGGASSISQFGETTYGYGGYGALDLTSDGQNGSDYGGGGGGASVGQAVGLGAQGLVIAAWGAEINPFSPFPPRPFTHGFVPGPNSVEDGPWMLLL